MEEVFDLFSYDDAVVDAITDDQPQEELEENLCLCFAASAAHGSTTSKTLQFTGTM